PPGIAANYRRTVKPKVWTRRSAGSLAISERRYENGEHSALRVFALSCCVFYAMVLRGFDSLFCLYPSRIAARRQANSSSSTTQWLKLLQPVAAPSVVEIPQVV